MICPKCGKECKPGAKFCGGCGYKFAEQVNTNICPKCGKECKPGAKFCGGCGYKFTEQTTVDTENIGETSTPKKDFSLIGSFIHWNVLPGQLAVKIDENDIAAYGKIVKGVNIQEGVKALFFVRGQLTAELNAGSYSFKDLGSEEFHPETVTKTTSPKTEAEKKEEKQGFFGRFIGAVANFFTGGSRQRAENAGLTTRIPASVPPVSIVLVRSTEFPMIFDFKQAQTANLRSEIGLHLICKITNINSFYANQLLDCKFISFDQLAKQLNPLVLSSVNSILKNASPEQIDLDSYGEKLLQGVQTSVSEMFPHISVNRILQLTATHADLENIRQMGEELYVSDKELTELSRRNDFLNRLQSLKNEQELTELRMNNAQSLARERVGNETALSQASMAAEFEKGKEKIYEEMSLTRDEKEKFDLLLDAQKRLREAKTENDLEAAMLTFEKSGLLRAQELENLKHKIQHETSLRDLNDAQALAILTMQNQQALDQQKLDWEIMVGNKRIENQFNRQRIEDAYHDERQQRNDDYDFSQRKRNADFDNERRRSTIAIDREEQQNQMDMLRQAQAIRMERENAEHRRQMEATTEEHQFRLAEDKQKLDAGNEEKRIYAGMSFEQIVAANPNITPEAAQALAKKFEAETAAAQNDKTSQMAIDQRDQMMTFMQQQMAMMKDMAMTGITAGGAHKEDLLEAKQAELERTRADASANNQAVLQGMETTVKAVSGMRIDAQTPNQNSRPASNSRRDQDAEAIANAIFANKKCGISAGKVCTKCGAALEDDSAIFCDNCGASL